MASTPGGPTTDSPAADGPALNDEAEAPGPTALEAPGRRAPMALVTGAFVLLVLLIVAVLVVVKVTRGTTTVTPPPVAPAPAPMVRAAADVAPLDLNTVGAPVGAGPEPQVLTGQSPLVLDGHPGVVYVGSEFCPYCAAVRWSLVVALSRFGTFSHLGATSSSVFEAFPQVQTFSFDGASYHSRYLTWSATEEYGPALSSTGSAGFGRLHSPTALERSLMQRYGPGASPGPDTGATLPFIDIGNRVLIEGAAIGFSPGVLQNVPVSQIVTDLSDPTTPVAQAVLGAANEITAAICTTTGQKPAGVCRSPGARAGATRLGLPSP